METLYVWLFLFAGGIIALLGMLLIASERELRKKRRDFSHEVAAVSSRLEKSRKKVDELQAEHDRLANTPSREQQLEETIVNFRAQLEATESRLTESAERAHDMDDRNSKLKTEIDELTRQLQTSQETIADLQVAQERLLLDAHSENQKLCVENQQLQQEIGDLKNQLLSSETLAETNAGRCAELTDRYSQLKSDAADLRKQLDEVVITRSALSGENEALASRLSASQRTVEEIQAVKDAAQSENRELQEAVRELQREIADLKIQLQMSESRINEALRQAEDMADCNSRLQRELAEFKQQLQSSGKTIEELQSEQQRMSGVDSENQRLQQEINHLRGDLQTSEARLEDSNRQHQESADRYARSRDEMSELQQQLQEAQAKLRDLMSLEQQLANAESREATYRDRQQKLEEQMIELQRQLSEESAKGQEREGTRKQWAETEYVAEGLRDENRRLVEELSRRQEPGEDSDHSRSNGSETAAPTARARKRKARIAIISAVVTLALAGGFFGISYLKQAEIAVAPEASSDEESMPVETASRALEIKPALALQGKFKITQPTEVYSAPTENSALITRIEPGIKVNVVGSRNGWLEIRSNHGRPPGFVRQEAAVKIDPN